MEKRRLTVRQFLTLGLIFIVTEAPRTIFAIGVCMTAYWLGCVAYVLAAGRPGLVVPVLARAAVFAAIAALGAVLHRLGNDDNAWDRYRPRRKRSDR